MKNIDLIDNPELSFDKYKQNINLLIQNKQIDKLKLLPNYFDITNNYWIVDKYIAMNGQVSPEFFPNTFDAYSDAIKHGYALCIPVQKLDDDSIVCFSHKNISKVLENTSGYLNKLTLAELKELKLNEKGDTVPTLDEALDFVANKAPIIIEINNEGMIGKFEDKVISSILKYINTYNAYFNVAIISINPYTLQYCYQKVPYITRILKSGNFTEKMYGSIPTKKLKKLKLYKITHADFLAYSADLLPCRYVSKHKPVGIIACNVTSQSKYLEVAPHADNIIFNNFTPTI